MRETHIIDLETKDRIKKRFRNENFRIVTKRVRNNSSRGTATTNYLSVLQADCGIRNRKIFVDHVALKYMAITKAKKQEIGKKLDAALNDSATAVFVQFKELGVEDNNTLRKTLKQNDSDYLVSKKTLLKRSMDAATVTGDQPELGEGMVAVAFGTDPMAPAREIFEFGKEHKGKMTIMGGIFDGTFKSQSEMMEIATIPGLDTLRGMFANVINSPVQRFAVVLDQVASKKA